jgi:hypothetical protein
LKVFLTLGERSDDATGTGRRGIPAWLMSLALHASLLVCLALLAPIQPRQPGLVTDRTAGIALVQQSASKTTYYSESNAEEGPDSPDAAAAAASSLPRIDQIPVQLAASLPSADGIQTPLGGGLSLPGADGFTSGGQGPRKVGGGGTQTQVFGIEGTGSRFIYVFDRSASMEGFRGRPMAAAKAELTASLRDLASVHQFQIIFYNERSTVFNPFRPQQPRMMFGTDDNKALAADFLRSINPAGSTRHMQALKLALGLRPDVIFLLTDADEPQLTSGELDEIRRRNRGTAVHAIEFGSGPFRGTDNFLVRLARQNNGQHVYVDVNRLSARN